MPNEGGLQWASLAAIPLIPCVCVNIHLNPHLMAIGPLPMAIGPQTISRMPPKIGQHPMEHDAQTSSHGPKTIKCLSMVLYCRELLLHSRGVEAFSRQGGPMWPWLHELQGMRRHLSKVDPNGPTVVPSCKADAIQLIQHHMPHTHAPPQNTHFTKTCPKPSRGHGRPPKHSWCHPSYILYICKKGPIRIPKKSGS